MTVVSGEPHPLVGVLLCGHLLADDYGHWYDRQGNLVLEVPYAKSNRAKAGMFKPTTMREARGLGLLPSVTTVLQDLSRPGLITWKMDRAVTIALENPTWSVHDVLEAADEYVEWAAQTGTKIHLGISEHFHQRVIEIEPEVDETVRNFWPWYRESGLTVVQSERSVVSPAGYAGTIDYQGLYYGKPALVDFKTQDFEEVKKALFYNEHALQLAGYDDAIEEEDRAWLSVIISRSVPGLVAVHDWTNEKDRWRSAWRNLWATWQDIHNYYPMLMYNPDNSEGNGWHHDNTT